MIIVIRELQAIASSHDGRYEVVSEFTEDLVILGVLNNEAEFKTFIHNYIDNNYSKNTKFEWKDESKIKVKDPKLEFQEVIHYHTVLVSYHT